MSWGAVFVMIAASLWAVDALIRTPLTQSLGPLTIVFWEHVIGLFVLSPWIVGTLHRLRSIRMVDWLWFGLLTLVSSVGGTVLFTQALSTSFASGDFITPLLLQKLQPLIVIGLSAVLLKERIGKQFFWYAIIACVGGYLMSFGLHLPAFSFAGKEIVVVYALGAASCWALGTILSKTVLSSYRVQDSIVIRFALAIPLAFLVSLGISQPLQIPMQNAEWMRFFLIALTTGALALVIYYIGLKKTPAHQATIAELIFPFVSVLIGITALNPYGQPQQLTIWQWIGIVLLLIGVFKSTQKT
jgi:drug/metabolite transporter, DME family